MVIWSMLAKSAPLDANWIVFVFELLNETLTVCVAQVVQPPLGAKVMLWAAPPFTEIVPVRETVFSA